VCAKWDRVASIVCLSDEHGGQMINVTGRWCLLEVCMAGETGGACTEVLTQCTTRGSSPSLQWIQLGGQPLLPFLFICSEYPAPSLVVWECNFGCLF